MSLAHTDTSDGFVKHRDCPPADTLLAFAHRALSPLKRQSVRLHLAKCEFCDAELRLLSKHPPLAGTPHTPAPLPLSLLLLAAASLPPRHVLKKPRQHAA